MTFANQGKAKHLKFLKDSHCEFPRMHRLNEAVEWVFTDYFAYADRASVDFSEIGNSDFHQRLSSSCADCWGLVIEFLIDALNWHRQRAKE